MPNRPKTYEDIVRATTPAWDLFRAPSGHERPPERVLEARIREALLACDHEIANVDIVVHGSEVWLSGYAIGPGSASCIVGTVERVPGVSAVHLDDLKIR